MKAADLVPGDIIMVDIDGNAVPCAVLLIETVAVKLSDTGSGRTFWRTVASLESATRFDGTIVTYYAYADWMLANRPDVTIRFLTHGARTLKEHLQMRKDAAEKAQQTRANNLGIERKKKETFTATELELLKSLLSQRKLS